MWPIVGMINNLPPIIRRSKNMMQLMALWVGKHQPNLQGVLKPLLKHLKTLHEDGIYITYKKQIDDDIEVENTVRVKVYVNNWMQDYKAKAPLQNFKTSGYHACGYCNIRGMHMQTIVYPLSTMSGRIEERKHAKICTDEGCLARQVEASGKQVCKATWNAIT
jgi:hypothetical protein